MAEQPAAPQTPVNDPAPAANPEPVQEPETTQSSNIENDRTVYVTETGRKYHYDNNYGNGTYYESTLQAALNRGLTPCKKCAGG